MSDEFFRLREMRLSRRMTQNEVAKALGVSKNHYAQLERGEKPIRQTHLQTLASL